MWGEDDGSPDETYDVNACSDTPNLEEDCRTDAWEQQAGEDWDAFTAAYESGWTSGCEIAFDTENNSLYEDDTEYTLDDCTGEYPGDPASSDSLPADYPDDADAAGDEAGQHDGCTHPFNEYASAGELYWGEDTYDESICP